MKLYRTTNGVFVDETGSFYLVSGADWDELICSPDLNARVRAATGKNAVTSVDPTTVLAPVVNQEVWAAGVTYYRSRNARIEESRAAGGGDFYDRVYSAERPELFFKATGRSVVGPRSAVRIRSDAKWSVPEPELTLLINPAGAIVGCTIGNDMSSRDIEGENPLYLPQAKVYQHSCAVGPWIVVGASEAEARKWKIEMQLQRNGATVFQGET